MEINTLLLVLSIVFFITSLGLGVLVFVLRGMLKKERRCTNKTARTVLNTLELEIRKMKDKYKE